MFKLKKTTLLISAILFAHNSLAMDSFIVTDDGRVQASASGELEYGKSFYSIGLSGGGNNVSIANNGAVNIIYKGAVLFTELASNVPNVSGRFQQESAVVIAHGGTLDLGSGSSIYASFQDRPSDAANNNLIAVRVTSNLIGTSTQAPAVFKAENIGIYLENQLDIDAHAVIGLEDDQDDSLIELSGESNIKVMGAGKENQAVGVVIGNGGVFRGDKLNLNITGQTMANGLEVQSGFSKSQPDVAKQSVIQYQDADIRTTTSSGSSAGLVTLGGKITATGDTTIVASINQSGGEAEGIVGADLNAVASSVDSYGKANLLIQSGDDRTFLRGVVSGGMSQITMNHLSVTLDTQAHQLITGTGLLADNSYSSLPDVAGKIIVNGPLNIDVQDTTRTGTYHFIQAEQGGEITLNGATTLGLNYNDPDALAILSTGEGSRVTGNNQRMLITGTIETTDSGFTALNAGEQSLFNGGFVTHSGGTSSLSMSDDSLWNMTKDSQLTNLTLTDSTLNFLHQAPQARKQTRDTETFKTLKVDGDYRGVSGKLVMNTQLGDDASPTDRMVVAGNTSGTTNVKVLNAGGQGGRTADGIELITVGGNSDGEFRQDGRIVAGAYDYTLLRGEGQNNKNWYLTSSLSPEPVPQDPKAPLDPQDPPKPQYPREHALRPGAGLYGLNLQAANTLFNTRLHDRLGETHYVDALTGEQAVTSMWLRNVGGHTRQHDNSGQLAMQANRYVMQLGGDIAQWSSDSTDRYHLGLMAGYANQKARAENQRNGNRADSRISGYSVGLYGTWLQDNETHEGAYVDTWAQYSWFNNSVTDRNAESEDYDSRGLTASVESGYTWKLSDLSERNALYIQPKAQVTWMGVKENEHREDNGTRVEGRGDGNIQTRVGVRLSGKGHNKLDDGKGRTFQPFVEVNWLHNTRDFGVSMDGENVDLAGTRNIGELKAGVEGQLTKNVAVWGNVAHQAGDEGYSDTSAMLGVKASF